MHIVDMVYYWARTIPLRPAVIEPQGVVTYASLAQATELAAEHFARAIVDRSKPVAISTTSNSKMLIAILGLLRAGFSAVLAYKAVIDHLPSVGVDTLVCERDDATLTLGTIVLFDDSWLRFGTNAIERDLPIPQASMKGGDIFCFTSGTTGRPKTVTCPQEAWQERMMFPLNSVFTNYERILIAPGLANSLGFSRAYEALHMGRTACFAPIGQPMLWLINTYGIDTIIATPQQALQLAEVQEKVTHYSLPSLKALQIGASIIGHGGVQRLNKYLCSNVIIIYGSTEAGPVAAAPYEMIAGVPYAVGFVLPGMEIEIIDADGRNLPTNTEGFVRVRSPVLLKHFTGGDSQSRWFYPGDVGWLTENGILCIAGRTSDVANRGGTKLSITDFEAFLSTCPDVKDAGVCTFMGASGFEEVWVGVVLDPAADFGAFRRAIEANAEFGKNIDKLFVVESIPRGTLGKIQREELKKMLIAIGEDAASSSGDAQTGVTSDA
jgi:acyl-coenzyme A synthetase/AMP-(fatty) acid ligase